MTIRDYERNFGGSFPEVRKRRLRSSQKVRDFVRETRISVEDLLWPLFIIEGKNRREKILGLPGVERMTIDIATKYIEKAQSMGICGVLLFPVIDDSLTSDDAIEAINEENLICRCVREVRKRCPEMMIICDVALDPYTSYGHDGILIDGQIDNDVTVSVLVKMALVLAAAGCDTVAPSDMMDGRIGHIRRGLDSCGFEKTRIISYAAKYASSLYGPFREALVVKNRLLGDKKTYQMDSGNSLEALAEIELDIKEGADIIMVKPGLWYLDILSRAVQTFNVPVLGYQVSGEYAMICAAENYGIDKWKAVEESLLCFKRAGARGIISYFALQWVEKMREKNL